MKNRVLLVKWSSFNFEFERYLRENNQLKVVVVTHHISWFSDKRNVIYELSHLIKQFIPIFFKMFFLKSVVFGTNACRLLYIPALLNSKVIFIFNEIPHKFSWYEKKIIEKISNRIYLSNPSRLEYFESLFNVKFGGVIPNLPLMKDSIADKSKGDKEIIYAGLINSKRLPIKVYEDINSSDYSLDLIGPIINCDLSHFKCNYLGNYSQSDSQSIQSKYRFALLSYSVEDVNNDLCAPIKVYEYINNYCVCICVNENKGLKGYVENYPNLFVSLSRLDGYKIDLEKYYEERNLFFKNESDTLTKNLLNMQRNWRPVIET